jgi:hypothetical protein
MRLPLVTFDTTTGELRSNPDGFAGRVDYVASLVWEKQPEDEVAPGDILAIIQWGKGAHEELLVPAGCNGRVRTLNRNILFEELGLEPSIFLARIL